MNQFPTEPDDYPGLEVHEDLVFKRRFRNVERAGMTVGVLLLVLSLAGFFGAGPLSTERAAAGDGSLEVLYDRYARRGGSTNLLVVIHRLPQESVRLLVDAAFLHDVRVDAIAPQPESVVVSDGWVAYEFSWGERPDQLEVDFHLTGTSMGPVHGRMKVEGGEPVQLSQFFYP